MTELQLCVSQLWLLRYMRLRSASRRELSGAHRGAPRIAKAVGQLRGLRLHRRQHALRPRQQVLGRTGVGYGQPGNLSPRA